MYNAFNKINRRGGKTPPNGYKYTDFPNASSGFSHKKYNLFCFFRRYNSLGEDYCGNHVRGAAPKSYGNRNFPVDPKPAPDNVRKNRRGDRKNRRGDRKNRRGDRFSGRSDRFSGCYGRGSEAGCAQNCTADAKCGEISCFFKKQGRNHAVFDGVYRKK